MRHNIYSILLAGTAIATLSGCEKESVFNMNPGEGQLNCRTFSVDYINNNQKVRSSEVELGDFVVDFVNINTKEVARSFKYSQMPEIVSLPQGNYRAEASYGDNPIAEWEAPYYLGDTNFEINVGKITDDVDPVECVLSNIRVRVNVSDLNLGLLGDDAQVVVHAGKEGSLTYNLSTTDKAGYFRFVENSHTLTAEFSGTVDGKYVSAIPLTFNNVEAGKAYDINFTINRPDNMEPGAIVIGGNAGSEISISAQIAIMDQTREIDPNEPEDTILVDDMRPVNGDNPGNNDNQEPKGPRIITYGFDLGEPYHIVADTTHNDDGVVEYKTPVKFTVSSETGLTEFKIVIDSTTLTPDELDGANLAANLDLINPGEFKDGLVGLGFPVENDVLNQKECNFDISGFIPLLNILGPGVHKFNITVSDSSGTSKGIIWLEN